MDEPDRGCARRAARRGPLAGVASPSHRATVPPSRGAPLVSLVALCLLGPGCYSTLYGWPRPPAELGSPERAGAACPDLSGTYANAAERTTGPTSLWDPARLEPGPAGAPGRHLAAFFADVRDPAAVRRVTFSHPVAGVLAVSLEDAAGSTRELVLREGADYTCEGGYHVFATSARLRRRHGGTIAFTSGPGGCLVSRTLARYGIGFLLIVPIFEGASGEWMLFCAPAPAGAEIEP